MDGDIRRNDKDFLCKFSDNHGNSISFAMSKSKVRHVEMDINLVKGNTMTVPQSFFNILNEEVDSHGNKTSH